MEINIFLAGIFLFICAVTDIKKKKISVVVCVVFLVAGLTVDILYKMESLEELGNMWQSFLPGIILILLAVVTKEKIGKGDGLVMVVMGILLGIEKSLEIFMTALFLSAVVAIGLIITKKVKRNYEIPFVPFLAVGMCLMLLGGV